MKQKVPYVELKLTKPSDGAFQYHDLAMSKDVPVAIAGRLLKHVHNALQAGLNEEVDRGLMACDLLDSSTTIASNVASELIQFAARGRHQDKRQVYAALANEFEYQSKVLAAALMATADKYRQMATE